MNANPATIIDQIERARRALRGEAAYRDAGYQQMPAFAQAAAAAGDGALPNAVLNLSTSGLHVVIPGAAGQRIEVFALFFWSQAEQTWELWDDLESLTGPISAWPAQTGSLWPYTGEPYVQTRAGNSLVLAISAAAQVSGFVKYRRV